MSGGVLLVDKPAGVTSHDVVARIRRERRGQKVGHAGTLDPFATGLLLILVGQATRAQRFFMRLPKTYRAVARLGWTSDTGDRDGRLAHTGRVPETLELPTGPIMQRPPAYSAVKIGGERLYERARRGDPVEGEPREVVVHRAELLRSDAERAEFEIECSSGTYVRQLIAGLGDAYCEELRRVAVGSFVVEDADEARVVPLDTALEFLPGLELEREEAEAARHGRAVLTCRRIDRSTQDSSPEAVRMTHDSTLIAIGRVEGDRLKPYLVFPAEAE
jgi:tRNA pseudouridine55 synthase